MKIFLPALALLVFAGCASEEAAPAEEVAPAVEETVEPALEETMDSTMTEPMEAEVMEEDSTLAM